jgi:hypothetical protein
MSLAIHPGNIPTDKCLDPDPNKKRLPIIIFLDLRDGLPAPGEAFSPPRRTSSFSKHF